MYWRISRPSILTWPGGGIVEARNQADDGGFAGAARAHKRRYLPRLNLETDVFQDRAVGTVAERDAIEFNFAFECSGPGAPAADRARG